MESIDFFCARDTNSVRGAVQSVEVNQIYWEYPGTDSVFDRNALLNLADELEPIFNPEKKNYYMVLPGGEIRLLLMDECQMMRIFLPCDIDVSKIPAAEFGQVQRQQTAESAQPQKPQVRRSFCSGCGTALKPSARFCPKCGRRL